MSKQHTPGPWKAINSVGVWVVETGDHHLLTKIPAGSVDAEGNATLMAAAPELLDALTALLGQLPQPNLGDPDLDDAIDVAQATVAKACRETAPPAPEPRKGEYLIPVGARAGSCRSCGADVLWITTAKGSAMPLSSATIEKRNGERYAISHFGDCPQAKGWSKK